MENTTAELHPNRDRWPGRARPVRPILRWAGSKRSLLATLVDAAPQQFGCYYEPFAGSACLYFALRPRRAVVADRNSELIRTYRTVRHRARDVADAALAWDQTERVYYAVRALDADSLGAVDRAARFVYLNRLCFNGVYRTNRRGEFNVPFGRSAGAIPSPRQWVECATALRAADLAACDFETALHSATAGDFAYLDPPYTRGQRDSYGVYGYGSFTSTDLNRLVACLNELDERDVRFLLSYRATPEVLEVTRMWNQRLVDVRAQVGGRAESRSVRRELLVANYD